MITTTNAQRGPAAIDPFDLLALIFVALWLGTSVVAFGYYSRWHAAEVRWASACEDPQTRNAFDRDPETVEDLIKSSETLHSDLLRLSHLAGWYEGEEAITAPGVLARDLDEAAMHLQLGRPPIDPKALAANVPTAREVIEQLERRVATLAAAQNPTLEAERDRLQGRYGQGGGEIGAARAAREAMEREQQARLDAALAEVDRQRRDNQTRRNDLVRRRDAERDKVRAARRLKLQLETRLFGTREGVKSQVAELEATYKNASQGLVQLQERLDRILGKHTAHDPSEPDGRVLSSSTDLEVAWLDLVRRDRVIKRMIFDVFRYRKGGKQERRGQVQLIRVGERMSQARVISRTLGGKTYNMRDRKRIPGWVWREFRIDPLGPGDHVRNPIYDKTKRRVFVIAGTLTGPPGASAGYTNEEAGRLIEELGDQVERTVSERTHFVILGKDYRHDANYARAAALGIPRISERELLEMLGKY